MKNSKIKKLCAVVMAATLAMSTLVGCGSKSSTASGSAAGKQEITFNLGADPKTIDPALNQSTDGGTLLSNCFDGLYKLDEDGKPQPAVAESYDLSEDKTEYTFHLRKDAKWTNGDPVKASDFEYAWKRVLNPDVAAEYAYQMMYLKGAKEYNTKQGSVDAVGVKAIDDNTLKVSLIAPCPYFLDLTAFPCYFPVNQKVVEENKDWTTDPKTYVSNGAFKLTDYKIKDGCTLEKNDTYYNKDQVTLDKLNVKFATQDTSSWANLKTGQFDVTDLVPLSEIQGGVKEGLVTIFPQIGTYFYSVNVSEKAKELDPEAGKALGDARVRKALNLAIDREAIVENVSKGDQIPATSFVSTGIKDENGKEFAGKEYFPAKGDVEQAKKLLAEAGYPDGQGFPSIVLLFNPESGHGNIAQAVQDMWKSNLGINVELQSQEWKVFQQTRNNKQFEIARDGWLGDYSDPMTFLDMLEKVSGQNNCGYASDKFDALVDAAKVEKDTAKRLDLLHQAEDQLMEDMPVIPIYYYTKATGINKNVKGLRVTNLGFYFFDKVTNEKTK
ncbi:MAG: peptide ABC transporter substrate-binding protein [Clostridium butyricum]|nr:peptide ABC transporter substrate-binding protein [Clostridium butyricum]